MININGLMNSERVVVSYLEIDISSKFVKDFRKKFKLTQIALANVMGVTKKAVEKWEQGTNKVVGSSAVLFSLISENPELLEKIRKVTVVDKNGEEKDFQTAFSPIRMQLPVEMKGCYDLSGSYTLIDTVETAA